MKKVILSKAIRTTKGMNAREMIINSIINRTGTPYEQLKVDVTKAENIEVKCHTESKPSEQRKFYIDKHMISYFLLGER